MTRRTLFELGTHFLGGLVALGLAIPGVAYLLTPLIVGRSRTGEFRTLARLGDLVPGVPQAFPIIDVRQDAWVKYPAEPLGTVWLIRQPQNSEVPVLAFTAECPHLGCAINLSANGTTFLCPCHTSEFDFSGVRLNKIPPRGMDTLEIEEIADPKDENSEIRIKFQRFRPFSEEKTPLV